MGRLPPTLGIFLLVSSTISGCMSEPANVDSEEEPALDENPNFDTPFSEHCIQYDDLERCWLLLVPSNLNETTSVPLLIDIHGGGDDMYEQRWTSDFANISMEQGFIVVYPQGHNNFWNMGGPAPCLSELLCSQEDDVGFILPVSYTHLTLPTTPYV